MQGDRRARTQVTMVQGRQGDQSGRHIRVDGQLERRLSGRLHLRGDQRHGNRLLQLENTSGAHRRNVERGQVTVIDCVHLTALTRLGEKKGVNSNNENGRDRGLAGSLTG